MASEGLAPCHICKRTPTPEPHDMWLYSGWEIVCSDCYDAELVGDPGEWSSGSITIVERELRDAMGSWNDAQAEASDTKSNPLSIGNTNED